MCSLKIFGYNLNFPFLLDAHNDNGRVKEVFTSNILNCLCRVYAIDAPRKEKAASNWHETSAEGLVAEKSPGALSADKTVG